LTGKAPGCWLLGDKSGHKEVPVTRTAGVFFLAMAGLAAACAMLCPAAASAATQCQSTLVTGVGAATEDQAIASWNAQVKQSLGVAWSNFNLAKDQKITEQNLALANVFFVTAYPCRTISLANPGILGRPIAAVHQP
jgi:hypothetical protein